MRAVYSAGESCDSNPIIASLDPHSSSSSGSIREVNTAQASTRETTHVHMEQSDGGGEESTVTDVLEQQTGMDIDPSRESLQSSSLPPPLAGVSATKPGSAPLAQTETLSTTEDGPPLLPLSQDEKDNNNSQPHGGEGRSLSGSTVSDHVVSGDGVDERSPSPSSSYQKPGEKESCSASPQPTPTSHTEIDSDIQYVAGDRQGGERNAENEAHLPSDFDSTHLFLLVPKGHHITDETVSVMSNATEEYVGGSSSRDTLSHDRSLTSMIFGARESGDSMSESELSDHEVGEKLAKKLDQSIEQIQKSYLSQLPPQNSHTSTSHEEEEEEGEGDEKRDAEKIKDGGQLHCCSIPVHHSHDGMINTDISNAVPAPGSINMTHESDSTTLHPTSSQSPPPPPTSSLTTFGIPTATVVPHPSPFLFDGVSSAISSKRILPSLHSLSDVRLQGELHGLALATTTSLTPDPDILTTGLGSSLQTDTHTSDTAATTTTLLARNKALGRPTEMLPEKTSEVAIAAGSDVSHSQSCGTMRENNEPSLPPLSLRPRPSHQPVRVCQEGSGEPPTVASNIPLGSQTTKPEAFHVAMSTGQSGQLLLGSALEAVPSEATGSATPSSHRIPTRDTGDFERDENFKGKPSSENIEPDASSAVRVREDRDEGKRNERMNKFDLEMATEGSADVEVLLPSQLGEGFDPLQDSEKLPSVANKVNLISNPTNETKTSIMCQSARVASTEHGTGGVTCTATSQILANNPQIPASREQQSPPAALDEIEEAVCTHKTVGTPSPPNSASSAVLASLLLSQLESDLNTA